MLGHNGSNHDRKHAHQPQSTHPTMPMTAMRNLFRRILGLVHGRSKASAKMAELGLEDTANGECLQSPVRLIQIGNAHLANGDYTLAEKAYREASDFTPENKDLLLKWSFALQHSGNCRESIAVAKRALVLDEGLVDAHYVISLAYRDLGERDAAKQHLQAAIALDNSFEPAYMDLCVALAQAGHYEECQSTILQAIERFPKNAIFPFYAGNASLEAGEFMRAVGAYQSALALQPHFPEALQGVFTAFQRLGKSDQAVAYFEQLAAANPGDAWTHLHLGKSLIATGQYNLALTSFRHALAVRPTLKEAHFSSGVAYEALGRVQDALMGYEACLALNPKDVQCLNRRGILLQRVGNSEAALHCFAAALTLSPEDTAILSNCAQLYAVCGQQTAAMTLLSKLIALDPSNNFAKGTLFSLKLTCCDWTGYGECVEEVRHAVRGGQYPMAPFSFLAISDSAQEQLQCAATYVSTISTPTKRLFHKRNPETHDRIHVAYLSADFHDHATAYLMAELFELHDRSKIVLTAISFGPDSTGFMRTRLKKAFDHFVDVRLHSDAEVARMMCDMEVDIAVDLKGYTTDSRPGILALRAAPIQVNYLGYPGTMGAWFIDYIVADRVVVPYQERDNYSEAIVYLPDSYQVNDQQRGISDLPLSRTACGLPETGMVFCCFNNNHKINPPVFSVWMRLLHAIPGSVLWLLADNPSAVQNLRNEATRRGVDPHRLVFAPRVELDVHLARHRLADLFLDTLPYNAHTTASDALWAGLPVLTCLGSAFAGRVAASLLYAIDLPELVTLSLQDYEQRALELANHPGLLAALRQKVEQRKQMSALFDTGRFCAHLESAYETMYTTHLEGDSPRSFSVMPVSHH